ncbi:MAG: serine/threonine protein kinase [Candidatus Abyssobacteria bacterium SURF_17]|uniref:Serine/threonine protein kinase n=1 Tax=Candidatus Abyssobacteria bacterium SURF_17 TaxID=2093361 RepID=A0A419F281_9BACT|nr:MAG: serine/threonine protein kinase [Candidatus Abyssubacteria bacterium SURF_17]
MAEEGFVDKRIESYRILAEIGRGGMGIVYKALDEQKDQLVAIKVLPADFLSDKRKAQYLDHEFKVALDLRHPNIIKFYRLIKLQDPKQKVRRGFLVMELVDGWNMRRHIQEQDLTMFQAVELLLTVCGGLEYIHHHGIVHGDMKPENILISSSGAVKIADFGLSQFDALFRFSRDKLRGTKRYMAPEQLTRKKVDIRTDIYSIGVSSYELFTGQSPYVGRTQEEVIREIVDRRVKPTPPSKIKPNLHHYIDRVILKAIEKNPQDRYQSMLEIMLDLKRVARSQI